MLSAKSLCLKWPVISVAFGLLAAFNAPAICQEAPAIHIGSAQISGIPYDWTHHHVLFSDPGTEQEAISAGRHEHWQKVVNDPRYVMHQLRKNLPVRGPAAVDAAYRTKWITEVEGGDGARSEFRFRGHFPRDNNFRGTGSNPSADIKRDWSMALGGPGLAAGHYPAKYSFSTTTASCSDYVVYPTGAAGSTTQATIVAFTNVYVGGGCGSTNPTVNWSYNTPPGGVVANSATANTSPVLSIDGKQIAYVETYGGNGYLVLLTMASSGGTVASPKTITYVITTNYRGCVGVSGGAPCYTTIPLGAADTNSAPYYVYGSTDTIFVGDNTGKLHEVTGAFNGTPAIDPNSSWPVAASTATTPALTSPVVDSGASGLIFVADATGYLHSVPLTGGTANVQTSDRMECGTAGIVDPPIVDSTTEYVYAFMGYGCDGTNNTYINRFPTGTSIGASYGTPLSFGNGGGSNPIASVMRAGTFDYQYTYGTGTSGNLYTCENGRMYQIAMSTFSTATTFNTPVGTVGTAAACSPVTEFLGVKANTTLSAATTGTATTTTLSAPINDTSNPTGPTLSVTVTSTTQGYICVSSRANLGAGDYIQVDSEIMYVTATTGGSCSIGRGVQVDRGVAGTSAGDHNNTGVTVTIYSTYITVATGANVVAGNYIQVGGEDMLVTATYTDTPGLTLKVTRAQLGTTAVTDLSGATVTVLSQIGVASSTGIAAGDYIQIDSEIMNVTNVLSGTSLLAAQAQLGTTAAAHANGATVQDIEDWIFASVVGGGNAAGCANGCVYNYLVTAGAASGSPTADLPESGGTSGFIIDNQSTSQTGAQQVYFSTLTGHTAVQASQAGLQ